MKIKSNPIQKPLKGSVEIPGDKSISHRSLIIPSISKGKSIISNILESEDVSNTLKALKLLNIKIVKKNKKIIIYGKGFKSLKKPNKKLYFGNSGTTARLMTGLLAGQNFNTKITGDKSLLKRPMGRIINPLLKMGAKFKSTNKKLPYTILGNPNLKKITYRMPVASSQIKSGIILACLNIKGRTKIIESSITRDHTELMLKNFKANISIVKKNSKKIIIINGTKELKATNINIPGDFSSASFFIVAGLLIKGSKILLKKINLNPTRTGLIKALSKMGANIKISKTKTINGEKIGDISVKYTKLIGCTLNKKIVPTMIDEYPILAIAAANATSPSKFKGLKELRVKESNRLIAIKENLTKFGIKCHIENNDMTIYPKKNINEIKKDIIIDSKKDHRIAMAFIVFGMLGSKKVIIKDAEFINTSFPTFIKEFNKIGAKISKWSL